MLQSKKVLKEAIEKGIAKLRKYYPKTGSINNRNKALYIALILDPRIKLVGLSNMGFSTSIISDIKTRFKEVYNI